MTTYCKAHDIFNCPFAHGPNEPQTPVNEKPEVDA